MMMSNPPDRPKLYGEVKLEEDASREIGRESVPVDANDDWWEYYVFTSRDQFNGSVVYELYPGDFEGDIKWWNDGSVYIPEEGFDPFVAVLQAVVPEIDFYGETRIVHPQLVSLLSELTKLRQALADTLTPDDLKRAMSGRYVRVNDRNFIGQKEKIKNMAEALQEVVRRANDEGGCLWFLGV